MGGGPSVAIPAALRRAGLTLDQMDLIEVNEAFAVQVLANERVLKWNPEKLNVHGGAIALGHPTGISGARIVVTLYHALKRTAASWASRRSAAAAAGRFSSVNSGPTNKPSVSGSMPSRRKPGFGWRSKVTGSFATGFLSQYVFREHYVIDPEFAINWPLGQIP
jgi:hypothetical protein